MNFRSYPTLRLLVALSFVVMALPAQEEREAELRRLKMERSEKEMDGLSEDERSKLENREKEEWANLTPEQRLERRTRRGASTHCQFVASVRPAKLLPGQSGTMVVAALLKGNAVIPDPAPVEVMRALTEAPVDLGPLVVRPANLGNDAQAYRGKPVYENYAWFEIPVTMRQDAKLGDKHRVAVDLKFDLFDGGSAMPIGRFLEQVAAEVEVGAAIDPNVAGHRTPTPAVRAEKPPVESQPTINTTDVPAPIASGDTIVAQDGATPPSREVPPVAQSGTGPAGGGNVLPGASEDGLPMPLLIGGGVFALLVVLLLALRRK